MRSNTGTMARLLLGCTLLAAATAAHAAGTIYVRVGDIEGESRDKAHPGWIEAEAFSHAVTLAGAAAEGTAGGRGEKPSFEPVTVIKKLDVASPQLWAALLQGTPLPVTIEFCRDGGDHAAYFTVVLSDARIVEVRQPERTELGEDLEQVRFDFSEIEISYTPQKPDGSADRPASASWNVAASES